MVVAALPQLLISQQAMATEIFVTPNNNWWQRLPEMPCYWQQNVQE